MDESLLIDSTDLEDDGLSNYQSDTINEETRSIYGPDLNDSFTNFKFRMSNTNTFYVNSSYTGENSTGTQANPFKSLDSAVSALANNRSVSAIYLANGIYDISSEIPISKTFYIVGESAENTVINANHRSNIFSISLSGSNSLNIFNISLIGGKSYYGGAIYANHTTLNIVNVIFRDNTAEGTSNYAGAGGAIYNEAGLCRIYNGTFINNKAIGTETTYAGAIYNDLGTTTILNSQFINNSVDECDYGSGGAIYNYNSFLTLFNSSLINNSVHANYSIGGAICNFETHNVFVINSTIDSNKLYGNYTFAPGIINKGALLQVTNSSISNNVAYGFSLENSTIFNIGGVYQLFDSTLTGNMDFNDELMNSLNISNQNLLMNMEDQIIVSQAFSDEELMDLPSKYDLRDYGWVTSARNQGSSGACWAFATLSALESYLLKYENVSYDLSENNMKNVMSVYGENGTDWTEGGNYQMALAYLLRWSGPALESQDYYSASSFYPEYIKDISIHVQDVMFIPLRLSYLDNNQIKAAILKYGALYTSIYGENMANPFYNSIPTIPNHAVAIVGWDDNYSASNFRGTKPQGDGAFIIKNSWGNDYGDKGFGYISYYDKTFGGYGLDTISAFAFANVENASNYGDIYQYDQLGNTYGSIGYGSNTAWFANQFIAESATQLSAIGFYTFGVSEYLANIYVNDDLKHSQAGNISYAGYHTIKLNNLVDLVKDDVFRVEVKLTTYDSLFPIAIESSRLGYSSKANASLNQSFISPDGINWYDISQDTEILKFSSCMYTSYLNKTNVCLKAYTRNLGDLILNFTSNASYYFKEDLVNVKVTLTNMGDYVSLLNLNFTLDDSLVIVKELCRCSKGLYNSSIGLWTINGLYEGESAYVSFVFNMSQNKEIVDISALVDCASDAIGKNETYTFNLFYDPSIRFLDLNDEEISNKTIDTLVGSDDEITIKLVNVLNQTLMGKQAFLSIFNAQGELIDNKTLMADDDGQLTLSFDLVGGNYSYVISFDDCLSELDLNVNVIKRGIDLIYLGQLSNYYPYDIKIQVLDENLSPLVNKSIVLNVLDSNNILKTYDKTSDADGFVYLNGLVANSYQITAIFGNDDYYGDKQLDLTVKILKKTSKIVLNKLTTTCAVLKSDKSSYLKMYLKDMNNKPVASKSIKVKLNSKTYSIKTNKDGLAKLEVRLAKSGTYSVSLSFAGDNEYLKSSAASKITVNKKKSVLKVSQKTFKLKSKSKTLSATLKDKNNKAVVGKRLYFKVNGKTYSAKTNKKGIANVKVKLNKRKTYAFSVKFKGDKSYKTISKKSKVKIK